MKLSVVLVAIFSLLFSSCSHYIIQHGKASYYDDKFNGRKTASGVIFRNSKRTAAHKKLPFGTKVKVVNLRNGRSVRVRINDRGPFVQGRLIDLSQKAAKRIGMIRDGITEVELRYKLRH